MRAFTKAARAPFPLRHACGFHSIPPATGAREFPVHGRAQVRFLAVAAVCSGLPRSARRAVREPRATPFLQQQQRQQHQQLQQQQKQQLPIDDGAGQWAVPVGKGDPGHLGSHDVGGVESLLGGRPLDLADRPPAMWERQTHALLVLLVSSGQFTVDELRRGIEALPPALYEQWGYYDKWAASMASILLERGMIGEAELDLALGGRTAEDGAHPAPSFREGQVVRVKSDQIASRWRKPHLRTPGYLFGAVGVVESCNGSFGDPEFLAFRGDASCTQPLYTVLFKQTAVWPEYDGSAEDTVSVEVYQGWLEAVEEATADGVSDVSEEKSPFPVAGSPRTPKRRLLRNTAKTLAQDLHDSGHSDHTHGHDHGHEHLAREDVEQAAVDKEGGECPGERISEALIRVLADRGMVTRDGVRRAVEAVDSVGTQAEGPRLVARAWVDDAFRQRLLQDSGAAAAELGLTATNSTTKTVLKVVESTEKVHNLVVCTLCSCYPLSILGLSPPWYKSREYRARAVREPRKLLKESFGLDVPADVKIQVRDSTADLRYLVLPRRPAGTEGWSEEELRAIVTRDTMIGVAVAAVPDASS